MRVPNQKSKPIGPHRADPTLDDPMPWPADYFGIRPPRSGSSLDPNGMHTAKPIRISHSGDE